MKILISQNPGKEVRLISECREDEEYLLGLCEKVLPWVTTVMFDNGAHDD